MLKTKQIEPVKLITVRLSKKTNTQFAQQLIEKYLTSRFWGQLCCLIFRKASKESEKSEALTKSNIPEATRNYNLYFKEYKNIISVLNREKEPVTIRTTKEKPVPLYIYNEKQPLIKTFIQQGKPTLFINTAGTSEKQAFKHYKKDSQGKMDSADKNSDTNYRTTGLRYSQQETKEHKSLNDPIQSDYQMIQHSTLPLSLKPIQIKNIISHVFGEKPTKAYSEENQKRHNESEPARYETVLKEQKETLIKAFKPGEQNFIYRKPEDITEFSNLYRINRNIRVQAEETHRRVTENKVRQPGYTNLQMDTVLKELRYPAAPKSKKLLDKQDKSYIDIPVPMTIHKNTTGFLPASKDSGLILYKPKQEKPRIVEDNITDKFTEKSAVYAQAVTSSKPVKVSIADDPEEVSIIAEKVYGIIEKRMEIQKDRRGLR